MMMCISKWFGSALTIALFAITVATTAAQEAKFKLTEVLVTGRVKSVDAARRTLFLEGHKEMFTFGKKVVIIRGMSIDDDFKIELRAGDNVSIFDQGAIGGLTSYIMVKQGGTQDSTMTYGTIKSIDKGAKTISLNFSKIEFPYAEAKVLVNTKNSRAEELRTGEHAIVIISGTRKLTHVLVERR